MLNDHANFHYYAINGKEQNTFTKVAVFIIGHLMRFFFRPQYHHLEYLPLNHGYMLMGNHISLFDPIFVHLTIPQYVYWVAKEELFRSKMMKWILTRLQIIPLNRHSLDMTAMKTIRQYIKEDKVIGLFPQGTRVDPQDYLKVKAQSGVSAICIKYRTTIVPFYLDGPYRLFHKNHIYFGAPYCLNPAIAFNNKKEQHQKLSDEIMRNAYSIPNKPYL